MTGGLVFDLRRFSVHDGGGIRTTIFLKGCPLSCKWCQNPEGIPLSQHLFYFKNKCIGCGACISACPNGAITAAASGTPVGRTAENESENEEELAADDFDIEAAAMLEGGAALPFGITIDRTKCKLSFECTEACPTRALAADSRKMTVDEVVSEALADRPFFKHGGGITLSGGEPFFQFDFALALLCAFKKEGIATAVESSLFVDSDKLKAALPYIDHLFADVKIFAADAHRAATGVSNELILENIKYILQTAPEKVTIRTPLIPNFTANESNIAACAGYISGIYPAVRYELLNYNPLAAGKYDLVEKEFCFAENPPLYTKMQMEHFRDIARTAGAKNVFFE